MPPSSSSSSSSFKEIRPIPGHFHFVAGQIGGMAGVVTGQPFDTVKVKLQTQSLRVYTSPFQVVSKYENVTHCCHEIYTKQGITGFYRGLASPLLAVGAQKSFAFGAFGVAKDKFELTFLRGTILSPFFAAIVGGWASSLVCCPVDQLKIFQQIRRTSMPLVSLWASFRKLVKKHGLTRGIYGAYPSVLLREVVGYSVYFTSYEVLNDRMVRTKVGKDYNEMTFFEKHENISKFLIGGFAGSFMWTVYYPIDVIKSKMQAKIVRSKRTARLKTIAQTSRGIFIQGGLRAFYTGITPALLRAFPTHAVIFLVYESVLKSLT